MIKAINRRFKVIFTLKNIIADLFCKIFLLDFPNKWSVLISDRLQNLFYSILMNDRHLKMISNTDLLFYQSKTFHNKEPETNKWIASMPSDGVFYDMGANVGVFLILASYYCRKVYAFEPTAVNYSILTQNLMANSLDKNIAAYCLAIKDMFSFDTMRLSSGVIGSAYHSFGINKDACHQDYQHVFSQGCLGISLDDLVYSYGFDVQPI